MTRPMSVEEFAQRYPFAPSPIPTEIFIDFGRRYLDLKVLPHQVPWYAHIENNMYSLSLRPREHGKSTTFRNWATCRLCLNPNLRLLIASHKEELADEFSRDILMQLERPDLQEAFNFSAGKPWRVGQAFIKSTEKERPKKKSTASLSTVAKISGVAGKRFDIVVLDDPFEAKDVSSERQRAKFRNWCNKELFNALDHDIYRKMVVIGTPKNVEDWYSELQQKPMWTCERQGMYSLDDAGVKHYLWPERFGEKEEAELRQQLEPDEFAMEWMCEPVAQEGIRLRREWIEKNFYTGSPQVDKRHLRYYIGVDPSLGSKQDRASYMAIAVIAFDQRPDRQDIYVVDLVRSKLSLAEQEDIIKATFKKWTLDSVEPLMVMESVMVNKTFADRMKWMLPNIILIDYIHTGLSGTSDVSKIGRIENIFAWLCKRGKVHLKDPKSDPMSKILIEHEYVQFPEGNMDLLDALTLAMDRVDLRKQVHELKIWKF